MTHVEKMRFQAALQALRGTDSPLPHLLACLLTSALPQMKAKQRRGLSERLSGNVEKNG